MTEIDILQVKGKHWKEFSQIKKEKFVDLAFQYWRTRGFPYYQLSEYDIIREFQNISRSQKSKIILGDELQMSMVGLKLANYFHPQMWSVKVGKYVSPIECFNNDEYLRAVIMRALSIFPDRYSVNESCMRMMVKSFKNTSSVSNFKPTVAKALYECYSDNKDVILDFSAGYGGRLLGCMPLDRNYIGIDPCKEQIAGLKNMVNRLKQLDLSKTSVNLFEGCAEDCISDFDNSSINLIFSSPPYFNKERYSSSKSQSYMKFPKYELWLNGFIGQIIHEGYKKLKRKGYFIINVSDINGYPIYKDTFQMCSEYFKYCTTYMMRMGNIPYKRSNKNQAYKYEPILVFQKK